MSSVRSSNRPLAYLLLCKTLAILALATLGCVAMAQSDPPSRVGRLSEMSGTVFLAPDDNQASWQPIGLNYPVTIGDNVWVSEDGRAEIDFGAGQVRLSGDANVHFSQLDDKQFSAYLASGRAILRLRVLEDGETAKFDTGNVQIDIRRPGTYRVETDADGAYSSVVVRDGEIELRVADRSARVVTGQTAIINGRGAGAALVVRDGYGTDGFDSWSAERDRRLDSGGLSSRYVSSYVPGVRDLDDYGAWETNTEYGPVWYPRATVSDWVPYRDGHWTHVRPWGWTWVDRAPWGWVPFHYGRWVHVGHRWGWCPGTFVSRPVYAPALVGWYGGATGNGWSATFGGGPIFGWVPLGWGEPYWPHHHHSAHYWRVANRPYAVNVNRVPPKPLPVHSYANARVPGSVTAVSGEVFIGRRPISGHYYKVPPTVVAGATVTTGPLSLRPLTKPLVLDNLPRGLPAPASTFLGRSVNAGTPSDLRQSRPVAGSGITSRPGSVPSEAVPRVVDPSPGPTGYARQPIIEPPPATPVRPGIGSTTPPNRQVISGPVPSAGRTFVREPMLQPVPPPSGGGSSVHSARPSPSGRPGVAEPMSNMPSRPQMREHVPIMTPQHGPGQSFAPAPKPVAPVVREPLSLPAPIPAQAPAQIAPLPQGRPGIGRP